MWQYIPNMVLFVCLFDFGESASLHTQCWITLEPFCFFCFFCWFFLPFSNKGFCCLSFLTQRCVCWCKKTPAQHIGGPQPQPRCWESSLCPCWFLRMETFKAKHDIKNSWAFEFIMQQEQDTPLIAWKINDFVVPAFHNAIFSYCVCNIFCVCCRDRCWHF